MKLVTLLAASALATVVAGCETGPKHVAMLEPSVSVAPSRNKIMVGESAQLVAHSTDLAGSSDVKWTVSPNVAKITADTKPGSKAIFSADQPGSYVITAAVQRPDGSWVTSKDISIVVNGNMTHMANEK